jgi:hypothetical protein
MCNPPPLPVVASADSITHNRGVSGGSVGSDNSNEEKPDALIPPPAPLPCVEYPIVTFCNVVVPPEMTIKGDEKEEMEEEEETEQDVIVREEEEEMMEGV